MARRRASPTPLLLAVFLALPAARAAAAELAPDPMSGVIGQLVAKILERSHYNHHPIDDGASRKTLRAYIDSLDYHHMIFDKADIDAFEALYAEGLDDRVKQGDLQPAYEIFNKFVERLGERAVWAREFASAKHDFTVDEAVIADRHEAPWPKDAAESRELWRLRVKHEILAERLNQTKPEEILKNINLRYDRLLRGYKEYENSDVVQTFLSALAQTFDPHSEYMAPPQKDNFDISMRLSLTGIGAVLRSEDGYAKIVSLVPGGPADVDKRLKSNDRIEAVAQSEQPFMDVVGMKLDRVVQLIRGEKGTVVRLRVLPNDALDPATRLIVTLTRDEIKLTEQEARAKILESPLAPGAPQARIGIIDLPSFYADMKTGGETKSTTRDVSRLIAALKKDGVQGLVLDLRRNGGGSLSEAITLTGLFIKEGPVVQVRDTYGILKSLNDDDGQAAWDGPMVVLTSRVSASASEILAGAMQDYRRAVVVGEKSTFGKGTVQSMLELDQYMPPSYRRAKSGALKLTIQKFYRVSGGSTQNQGVVPDIHLPAVADHMEITESTLKNALPYDVERPAAFEPTHSVTAALHVLRRASEGRIAASPEFAYVQEDIIRYKRQLEDKTISLNEAKRLAEKAADKARVEGRKKERAGRKTEPLKFEEITLQSLDGKKPKPAEPAVAKSTAAAEGEDYEKAPASDYVLEESLSILSDLVALTSPAAQNASGGKSAPPPTVR